MGSLSVVAAGVMIALLMLGVLVAGAYIRHRLRGAVLLKQIRSTWPPEKVALIAYTKNRKWSPYIDERILTAVAKCAVVVDRSNAQWKQRHPVEERAIRHWAGRREYNPVVITFIPMQNPKVFRFYEAFQDTRRRRHEKLERQTASLLAALEAHAH